MSTITIILRLHRRVDRCSISIFPRPGPLPIPLLQAGSRRPVANEVVVVVRGRPREKVP